MNRGVRCYIYEIVIVAMDKIDEILSNYLFHQPLTEEEEIMLQEWMEQSEKHKRHILRLEHMTRSGWKEATKNGHENDYRELRERVRLAHKQRLYKHRARYLAAAGVALLMGISLIISYFPLKNNAPIMVAEQLLVPGEPRAQLILSDGKNILLSDHAKGTILSDSTLTIRNQGNELIYSSDKKTGKEEYNTLVIPIGAEYTLSLVDGSKVFLNSGSEIRYPVTMNGEKREVYLKGEAYFEIQKKEQQPFIVHTEKTNIEVLGTSFNVNAYPEQETISTTLEEGKIKVTCNGESHEILPGMQLVFDKSLQKTSIRQVDTELYTSWRNGYYKFNEMPLEEILTTLSLWYEMEVSYLTPAKRKIEFTGQLRRYENVTQLLNKFGQTHEVTFDIKGKQVFVK